MELGKIEEIQFAGNVAFDLLAPLFADAVPFIDGNHQRAPCFQGETGNRGILVGDVLLRIQHQNGNVCRFNRLHGFDNGELFHRLIDFAAAAHTCGIDDGKRFAFALEIDVDTVARRACHIEGNHALFAENGVNQRGFADIRTTDNGKNGMFYIGFFGFRLREIF